MQQCEDHDDIGVLLGRGHHIQILMLDISECRLIRLNEGRDLAFILAIHDQTDEFVDHIVLDVAAIIPANQHFALHIQDVDRRENHDGGFRWTSKRAKMSNPVSEVT